MPLEGKVFNLRDFVVDEVTGENPVTVRAHYIGQVSCPHCGAARLRKKDRALRVLHHERMGLRACNVEVSVCKYRCNGCGRYFWQRFPGLITGRRSTEPFRKQVVREHMDGISLSRLSGNSGISASTVERWSQDLARRLVKQDIRRMRRQSARDFHAAAFTTRQAHAEVVADVADVEFLQQAF